jgi:hypothetical protein
MAKPTKSNLTVAQDVKPLPEVMYALTKNGLNTLVSAIQELPYKTANPIINFLTQNLKEINPPADQEKEEGK